MREKKRAIDRSGETQGEEMKREKEGERDSGKVGRKRQRESENENEKEKGGTAKQICSNK